MEAAGLRVERGHRARAVDADEPVRLRAADGGVGERAHRRVGAERTERVADRGGRHRLQPQPLDRLRGLRVLDDVAEDELAFATRVARVDELRHVLAPDQLQEHVETARVLLDRVQRELRRNGRQVRERPLAALHLLLFRHADLEQMADRGGEHVPVALEVIAVAREAAERARDVGGDGRFLGDDQRFRHGVRREERQIVPKSLPREQENILTERGQRARARTRARTRVRRAMQRVGLGPRLPEPAGQRGRTPRELECEQRRRDRFGRESAPRGERVDVRRRMSHRGDHRALDDGELLVGGRCLRCGGGHGSPREAELDSTRPPRSRPVSRLRAAADGSLWRTANGSSPAPRRLRVPAPPRSAQ